VELRRADERDLEEIFDRYGKIRRIDIKTGFGFVEFYDDRDAEDAIKGEDGQDLLGRRLQVEEARGGRGRGGGGDRGDRGGGGGSRYGGSRYKWRLRVENLDSRTSWQDLKDFARKAGDVAYTDVSTNRGKKMGVIEYTNESDMLYALKELDDTRLDGKYVRLKEEGGGDSRDSRSRSPKRSSRRDRSRSRSRSDSRDDRKSKKRRDDDEKDEKDDDRRRDDDKEEKSRDKYDDEKDRRRDEKEDDRDDDGEREERYRD